MARLRAKPFFLFVTVTFLALVLYFSRSRPSKIATSTGKTSDVFEPKTKIEEMMVKNMLKAQEKQLDALTEEEFKKLPNPEDVIKIAKGPVARSKSRMTVLQKLSNILHNNKCSRQISTQKEILVLIRHVVHVLYTKM